MEADQNGYSTELDKRIEYVDSSQLQVFCRECTCSIQKAHTKKMSNRIDSRSYWQSKSLYEAYRLKYSSNPFDDGTIESGNTLIDKMTVVKKEEMEGSYHVHQYESQ